MVRGQHMGACMATAFPCHMRLCVCLCGAAYLCVVRHPLSVLLPCRKRSKLNLPAALRLPVTGSRPSSRMLVLNEQELGNMSTFTAVPGALSMFNRLFSWGFMFTIVIVTFGIFLMGPFIGMFVACFDVVVSLLRAFSRSEGRLVADLFGCSVLVDQQIAYMVRVCHPAYPQLRARCFHALCPVHCPPPASFWCPLQRERMAADTEYSAPAAYLSGNQAPTVGATPSFGTAASASLSPLTTPLVQYAPGTTPPAAYPAVYQAAPAGAYNQDPSARYSNA